MPLPPFFARQSIRLRRIAYLLVVRSFVQMTTSCFWWISWYSFWNYLAPPQALKSTMNATSFFFFIEKGWSLVGGFLSKLKSQLAISLHSFIASFGLRIWHTHAAAPCCCCAAAILPVSGKYSRLKPPKANWTPPREKDVTLITTVHCTLHEPSSHYFSLFHTEVVSQMFRAPP